MKQFYHGAKQLAWEAVRGLYVKRLAGAEYAPEIPDVEFPAAEIAESASLPVSNHISSHEAAFSDLRARFEQVWA